MVPFPEAEWVPTRDVPTDPNPIGPAGDPNSIVDPKALDFARLADLRYALLLGFLEQSFLTEPAARGFLIRWCYDEMRSLRELSDRLTDLPRAGVPGQVAALPFTLPALLHLPEGQPQEQWRVHVDRFDEAIALIDRMLQTHSPSNSFLRTLKVDDQEKRGLAEQARQGVLPTAPGRWEQVRRILDAATGIGQPGHGGEGRFRDLPLNEFVASEILGLPVIEPPGPDRWKNSILIKALKGEAPFDGSEFPRMPIGRPPVTPDHLAFIESWIDDDCPEIYMVAATSRQGIRGVLGFLAGSSRPQLESRRRRRFWPGPSVT